jgi:hypothetical protein
VIASVGPISIVIAFDLVWPPCRWEEDLDCLDSDDEATEEEKCEKMRRMVGRCNALDKEEELDDDDRLAMGVASSAIGSVTP